MAVRVYPISGMFVFLVTLALDIAKLLCYTLCMDNETQSNGATEMTQTQTTTEHVFTTAGLGMAPFSLLSVRDNGGAKELRITDHTTGIDTIQKWGGTCHYCGKFITVLCDIKSTDGRISTVGSSCVRLAGDYRLCRLVDLAVSKARKVINVAKLRARKAAAKVTLSSHPELMTSDTHPQEWRANKGESLRHWAIWMLENAGAKGQTAACIAIERSLKEAA